jgi:hypothetical protein
MTSVSSSAALQALQPYNSDEETSEPVDKINAVSLMLAATSGLTLLAIFVGSILK